MVAEYALDGKLVTGIDCWPYSQQKTTALRNDCANKKVY